MATNKKITELTELTIADIANDDVLAIVDISAGTTHKIKKSTFTTAVSGVVTLAATSPLAVDASSGDVTASISTTPSFTSVSVTGDTSAGDDAKIGYTSAEGLILTGQGSTNDVTIKNDADADVITIATGATNVDIVGDVTASTVNADGDTAAADNAAMGYTSAEGLILTGQGSTNDVTIKNDADADVITIATGATNVDVVGDLTASTLNADGDTAASDNAAIGYTSAEGLILTGQGSTNDVTIKNDADADVIKIPTGTTNVTIVGNLTTATGGIATASLADDAVTLAKMAGGTDGNIISYDTSGNPVAVATGNDGQVLTSSGAGAVCAFEDAAGGKMLQVVSATTTTQLETTSTSYVDCTNLTASITPATTGSKVLVLISVAVFTDSDNAAVGEFKIVRTIGASATDLNVFSQISHPVRQSGNHFLMQLDSPSTTSATTYKLQVFVTDQSGFLQINRNDGADIARSVITLIEVGA